jgi:hypothetical protein
MKRLRIGIILFIISWLPIAQGILIIAHNHQKLTSDHASEVLRITVWTIQFFIGLVGVWLAGKVAFASAKKDGWRKTPKNLWRLFWSGSDKPG